MNEKTTYRDMMLQFACGQKWSKERVLFTGKNRVVITDENNDVSDNTEGIVLDLYHPQPMVEK